jgi:ubiquinone/menaquinone biosynthesis C-methylase UbiE
VTSAVWRASAGCPRSESTTALRLAHRPRNGRIGVQKATDYEHMAERYDAGRALPLEWIDAWRVALGPHLRDSSLPVLDLGSGTCLWSDALARWFGVPIVGVEPSHGMRQQALRKGLAPGVKISGGTADHIPLKAGSCHCAWLSTVLHHIPDVRACARELRRVLRPHGAVLVRNSFGDRLEGIHWLQYFPAAQRLAARRWPSVEATAQEFHQEGFEVESLHTVSEVVAEDLRSLYDRIRVRANSTLTLISDDQFEQGLERLREAAGQEQGAGRVVDQRDLLVLR